MSSYIISHIYTARQNESSSVPLSSLKKTLRGCENQKTLRMFLTNVGPIRPNPRIQTREFIPPLHILWLYKSDVTDLQGYPLYLNPLYPRLGVKTY